MRVFAETAGTWGEIDQDILASVSWVETTDAENTCQVQLAVDWEYDVNRVLIVPSFRESLQVPCFGPYDVVSVRYESPTGSVLAGRLGHDFAQLFATGDAALIETLGASIKEIASSGIEPFLGWTSDKAPGDSDNVAKLGVSFAGQATAALWQAGSIQDVDQELAPFGLRTQLQAVWDGTAWGQILAIYPKYPTLKGTTYAIDPPYHIVTQWAGGLPVDFARRIATHRLDTPEGDYCAWLERPTVEVPDLFNAPTAPHPIWSNRRIQIGFRQVGISDVELFATGHTTPALYLNPEFSGGLAAKFSEERTRWDLQNTAAKWTGTRVLDDSWETLEQVVLEPDQILVMPKSLLPESWPDNRDAFAIRTVRHNWNPTAGYTQQVDANLWLGSFFRLAA